MQELSIEGVDVSTGTLTKRIPATSRGANAKAQPPKWIAFVGVAVPLAGVTLPTPQLKEYDGEHQIGWVRCFATVAIGLVERLQVEVDHGVSNLPCEMIVGELRVKSTPQVCLFSPGCFGKTNGYLGRG